ncbi:MAG: hypothetical protein JXA92_11595 [candidate division Zixibacteria bacterium]|nr:hypothetical protein [candidate division Zixibacteria bacterium]
MKKTVLLTTAFILGIFLILTQADEISPTSVSPNEITPDAFKQVEKTSLGEQAGFSCPYNATVYGQPAHGPGDSWSIGISDKFASYLIYDDFSGAGVITGLHFWGATATVSGGPWSPCSENPVYFGFVFKDDNAGYPDAVVANRYAIVEGTPTGQFYSGFELYSYEVRFEEPVELDNGWLCIYGTGGAEDCWFGWVSGTGGDGQCWHYDGLTPNIRYYDQAFCLLSEGCPEWVTDFGQAPILPSSSNFRSSDDGSPENYCVYDNFSGVSQVASLHFWGITGQYSAGWYPCAENPVTFYIKFYYDNSGTPGSVAASMTKTIMGSPTGLLYIGGDYEMYEYVAYFPPVVLTDGWVSIQGTGGATDCWFLWASSRDVTDNHCYQWNGSTLTDQSFDMAMCLFEDTVCCAGDRGNVNCSLVEVPDISDITRLIDYLYLSHTALCCPEEADVNGSGGEPDISDITRLIDFLYLSHAPLPGCY